MCGKVLNERYSPKALRIPFISMIETSHHFELQWICVYLLCYGALVNLHIFTQCSKHVCQFHCLRSFFVLRFSNRIAWIIDSCGCWSVCCVAATAKSSSFTTLSLSLKMCNYHIHIEWRRRRMCRNWDGNDDDDNYNVGTNCIQSNANIMLWLHITINKWDDEILVENMKFTSMHAYR